MTEATSQELNRPLRPHHEAEQKAEQSREIDRLALKLSIANGALRDIICRSSDPTAVFIAERALADAEGQRKGEGR